ncbi:unnamed protein product [Didymodactylos carnosus]|uniref:Neurotransmitter-gated ion-channel transmembrane domain-containing protein n=1 Tax=Didymodactylos carnosus TaxID=1234261 RepID=A0A815Y5M7_9BILA|nr:unnamed protein product [Didymodactylos carnosus]CAF1565890.1 unnamed protein product [Didymodactylos carnosus]CAF3675113.1 unnamed protein product [Didymodactylos carnosus]CAF4428113.1 unnamed protein product [Didymodactylos carnosus]
MVVCSLSVVATVLVLTLHHRNAKSHIMPYWIRRYICCYLAWLLRMRRPNQDLSWEAVSSSINLNTNKPPPIANDKKEAESLMMVNDNYHELSIERRLLSAQFEAMNLQLKVIVKELCVITDNIHQQEKSDNTSADWKFAAMVLDRLCLWLFSILTIVFTCAILFTSRNIFKLY